MEFHVQHAAARAWLEARPAFTTSPLAELGFIRVSMTPGYRASFADAQAALANITSRLQARWVSAELCASKLPPLASPKRKDAYPEPVVPLTLGFPVEVLLVLMLPTHALQSRRA